MRISDLSSDVCSSDLRAPRLTDRVHAVGLEPTEVVARADVDVLAQFAQIRDRAIFAPAVECEGVEAIFAHRVEVGDLVDHALFQPIDRRPKIFGNIGPDRVRMRSEEHTSELQSLMRNSYAVFCLKK